MYIFVKLSFFNLSITLFSGLSLFHGNNTYLEFVGKPCQNKAWHTSNCRYVVYKDSKVNNKHFNWVKVLLLYLFLQWTCWYPNLSSAQSCLYEYAWVLHCFLKIFLKNYVNPHFFSVPELNYFTFSLKHIIIALPGKHFVKMQSVSLLNIQSRLRHSFYCFYRITSKEVHWHWLMQNTKDAHISCCFTYCFYF